MRSLRMSTNDRLLLISTTTSAVDTISLTDCTLTWREIEYSKTSRPASGGRVDGPTTTRTEDVILLLREVNPAGITVQPETVNTDHPAYAVRIPIRKPEQATSTRAVDSLDVSIIRAASLPVQTAEDGERIANAVKHAAKLCNGSTSLF
jgi:hypothetical protein